MWKKKLIGLYMDCCFPYETSYRKYCNFCNYKINSLKKYYFIIQGPGKHNDKIICSDCLEYKLLKGIDYKNSK